MIACKGLGARRVQGPPARTGAADADRWACSGLFGFVLSFTKGARVILTSSYWAQPWRSLWSWSERVLFFPCGVPFPNFWSPVPLGVALLCHFLFLSSFPSSFILLLTLAFCSFKLFCFHLTSPTGVRAKKPRKVVIENRCWIPSIAWLD